MSSTGRHSILPPLPRLALTALTTGIVLTTSSGIAIAPFLLDMASDRLGRRPLLLAGLLVLGTSRLLLGLTPSYLGAVAAQVIGGARSSRRAWPGRPRLALSARWPA